MYEVHVYYNIVVIKKNINNYKSCNSLHNCLGSDKLIDGRFYIFFDCIQLSHLDGISYPISSYKKDKSSEIANQSLTLSLKLRYARVVLIYPLFLHFYPVFQLGKF